MASIFGVLCAGILAFGLVQLARGGGEGASVSPAFEPYPAPELAGRTLDGETFSLADVRGKPAVVNFWASWCAPCREEAPELAAFAKEQDGVVSLVGVNVADGLGDARDFASAYGWRFPSLRDQTSELAGGFGVSAGLPTTFIVDARGTVVGTIRGKTTAATLRERIAALTPAT